MKPRKADDSINLEDSGTLELDRPVTTRQPLDAHRDDCAPELPAKPRQGDSRSRELLANPFTSPDVGSDQA